MADIKAAASPELDDAQKSLLGYEEQRLGWPSRGDGETSKADVESGSEDSGEGGEPLATATPFNGNDRPEQDVLCGRVILVAMVVMLVGAVGAFLWPILSLKLPDSATLPYLLSTPLFILLGLAAAVPACFQFLRSARSVRAPTVFRFLLLCICAFGVGLIPLVGMLPAMLHDMASSLEQAHPNVGGDGKVFSGILTVELWRSILFFALNAGALIFILCSCKNLLPLAALIISDSAKFILTRGRGLVFTVLALAGAMMLTSIPAISVVLQVGRSCLAEFSSIPDLSPDAYGAPDAYGNPETYGNPDKFGNPDTYRTPDTYGTPNAQADANLCQTWISALLGNSIFLSFLSGFGRFIVLWFSKEVQYLLQFVAAHVVGQCYGNIGASVDEDDMHPVIRAAKCAFKESFGSISLLSLVSAATSSMWLGLPMTEPSAFADVLIFLISGASFALSHFLGSFLLPLVALTGQSFKDSILSTITLLQKNLVCAVAMVLSTVNVIGVLELLIFTPVIMFALVPGYFLVKLDGLVLGSLGGQGSPLFMVLQESIVLGTSVCALAMFHWVFSTTIFTLFVCLALDGKAIDSTLSTPLAAEGLSL